MERKMTGDGDVIHKGKKELDSSAKNGSDKDIILRAKKWKGAKEDLGEELVDRRAPNLQWVGQASGALRGNQRKKPDPRHYGEVGGVVKLDRGDEIFRNFCSYPRGDPVLKRTT